jgi:hypothetical protein
LGTGDATKAFLGRLGLSGNAALKEAVEVAGAFSGRLDFSANKKGFDPTVDIHALRTW